MRRGGRGPVAHAVRPRGSAPPRAHGAIAARGRRLSYTFQPACRRGHADADEGAQRGQAGGRRPLRDRRRGARQPLVLLEPAGAKAPRLFLLLVRRVCNVAASMNDGRTRRGVCATGPSGIPSTIDAARAGRGERGREREDNANNGFKAPLREIDRRHRAQAQSSCSGFGQPAWFSWSMNEQF